MTYSDMMDTGLLTEFFVRMHEFEKHGDTNPDIPPVKNIQDYEFSRNEMGYIYFRKKGLEG